MPQKNTLLIVCVLFLLMACVVAGALATNPWFLYGEKVAKVKSADNTKVIALVNGKPITQRDLDLAMLAENQKYEVQKQRYSQLQITEKTDEIKELMVPPKALTRNEVLMKLIDDEIMFQAAKEKGLAISQDEARNFMLDTRQTLYDIISGKIPDADRAHTIEQMNIIRQTIAGMGITEEQYWELTVPIYQKILSIGKLKKNILQGLPEKDRQDMKKVQQYLEEYKRFLRNNYQVEFIQ